MTSERAPQAGAAGRAGPSPLLFGVVALAAGLAGAGFLETGSRSGISAGILLLVAMLGAGAVAVGGGRWGPETEGKLDLSTRLGLGLLAGVLAGLFHALLTEAIGGIGLASALGVRIDVELSAREWGMRSVYGAVWGLIFGLSYRGVPGTNAVAKGAAFSLLPSLYQLFVVYPVLLGLGFLGVRAGALTFLFVLAGVAMAGVVAALVLSWGEKTDLAPVSAPLVR